MTDAQITPERIDELLRFLPALDAARVGHGLASREPERGADHRVSIPDPAYPPEVVAFFKAASQEWWRDVGYGAKPALEMIRDDAAIATASLDEIKTLLTFCVRGERFCDGFWGEMIRDGRLAAILRRLEELRGGL